MLQSNYDPQGIWLGTFKSRSKYWVINTYFSPVRLLCYFWYLLLSHNCPKGHCLLSSKGYCIELLMQIVTSRLFWYVVFLLSPRGCYIFEKLNILNCKICCNYILLMWLPSRNIKVSSNGNLLVHDCFLSKNEPNTYSN